MLRRYLELLKTKNVTFKENLTGRELSTIRIGGPCRLTVMPACGEELIFSARAAKVLSLPFVIIGRGSNLLFPDEEFSKILILTTGIKGFRFERNAITADAGCSLSRLAFLTARQGYADLAFAAGIPGTVGGGVFMNAGAHGFSLSDVLLSVTAYKSDEDKIKTYFPEELNTSYRYSVFQDNNEIILRVKLRLNASVGETAMTHVREYLSHRRKTQPLTMPSAGSFFRRPAEGYPLSALLDEMGLKGLRIQDAAVSKKHAGFIVNLGAARAADVKALAARIADRVEKEKGFRPVPEVRFL